MSEYTIDPKKFEIISSGENATLYLYNDLAIKVPLVSPASRKLNLNIEYDIQKEIFSNNYPVPEPYEISSVCIKEGQCQRVCDAFFMERIYGTDLEKMFMGNLWRRRKARNLMDKASGIFDDIRSNLDVNPAEYYGLRFRNVMYDTRKKRVVLIDFGNWEIKIDGC